MTQIKWIDSNDNLLTDVKILGKQNAKTLGFLPEGAFDEHAVKKRIVVAVQDGKLAGYVLYRINQSKRILFIAHLCINSSQRKNGIAHKLLNAVREKHKTHCNGMRLSCREDYFEASALWQKYGFKPKGERTGRSKDGHKLKLWYYDFGNQDLFSQGNHIPSKMAAVLDANILIKLRDETGEEEVLALQADWLTDEVDYYYAQEFFVEINNDNDHNRANRTRRFIANFTELRSTPEEVATIYSQLLALLPGDSDNDHCDRKQVAETIVCGMEFFITLDTGILNASEILEDNFGVKVLRPAEFIRYIDYIRNNANYRPYRVAGAQFEYRQLNSTDANNLCETFLAYGRGEKLSQFKTRVHTISVDIKNSVIKLVHDNEGKPIGFFAVLVKEKVLYAHVIRTVKSKLGYLLFQQMCGDILKIAMERFVDIIEIDDSYIDEDKIEVIASFGFKKIRENIWRKVLLQGTYKLQEVLQMPVIINNYNTRAINQAVENNFKDEKNRLLYDFERYLYPGKILDLEIPCYIVPIRPHWAGQLFDHYITNHNLFGSEHKTAWRKENIYYRSVKPVSEIAPGRILWYVSAEKHYPIGRSSGIGAVSYLDDVHIDAAKRLFQKFKDFGIYTWDEIYKLAGSNASQEIKALRFSDTEVFEKIVPLQQVNIIFKQFERFTNTFASPVAISSDIFNEIYRIGKTAR